MGRSSKKHHKFIEKIYILDKNGKPALTYNLDSKGRLIYNFPVCTGVPGHLNYSEPGEYTYRPPPVRVYKKASRQKDPSIVGNNTFTFSVLPEEVIVTNTITGVSSTISPTTIEMLNTVASNPPQKSFSPISPNPSNSISPPIQKPPTLTLKSSVQHDTNSLLDFIIMSLSKDYEKNAFIIDEIFSDFTYCKNQKDIKFQIALKYQRNQPEH